MPYQSRWLEGGEIATETLGLSTGDVDDSLRNSERKIRQSERCLNKALGNLDNAFCQYNVFNTRHISPLLARGL